MLHTSTIKYLRDLTNNNNKPWFEIHRKEYEEAKNDFGQFITTVLEKLSVKDEDIRSLEAKECLFRINKDIRFAKDKTPYKTNMGASISRGGKKSVFAGYYFHCEPGKSFAGGGIWMPMPEEMKKIRQEIDYCYDEYQKIIKAKSFVSVYGDLNKNKEYTLVNLPKGYEKDNPAAEYIKLKSWVSMKPIPDKELTAETLVSDTVKIFEALQPLVKLSIGQLNEERSW